MRKQGLPPLPNVATYITSKISAKVHVLTNMQLRLILGPQPAQCGYPLPIRIPSPACPVVLSEPPYNAATGFVSVGRIGFHSGASGGPVPGTPTHIIAPERWMRPPPLHQTYSVPSPTACRTAGNRTAQAAGPPSPSEGAIEATLAGNSATTAIELHCTSTSSPVRGYATPAPSSSRLGLPLLSSAATRGRGGWKEDDRTLSFFSHPHSEPAQQLLPAVIDSWEGGTSYQGHSIARGRRIPLLPPLQVTSAPHPRTGMSSLHPHYGTPGASKSSMRLRVVAAIEEEVALLQARRLTLVHRLGLDARAGHREAPYRSRTTTAVQAAGKMMTLPALNSGASSGNGDFINSRNHSDRAPVPGFVYHS